MARATGHVERRGKKGWTTLVIDYGEYMDHTQDPPKLRRRREKEALSPAPGKKYMYKEAAEAILAERLQKINGGNYVPPSKLTFGEILSEWFAECERRQIPRPLRPKTLENYEMHMLELKKELGHYRAQRVDAPLLSSTFERLLAEGRGVRSMEQAHQVLNIAMNWAVNKKRLSSNPMADVPRPKPVKQRRMPLNVANLDKVLGAAEGSPIRHLMAFAAYTGLRRGELIALKWTNVDLKNRGICIDEAVSRVKGQAVTGRPKSDAGIRFVPLMDEAFAVLKELAATRRHELVFCWPDGRPYRPDYVTKTVKKIIKKAGFSIRPHDLRHTFATLGLLAGVSELTMQAMLGHENVKTTKEYTHVLEEIKREAAATISKRLKKDRRHQLGTKNKTRAGKRESQESV